MHVARVVRKYQTKDGPRESVSHLLRRSFRAEGKIRHETLANVSALPEPALAALRAALAGKSLLVAGESFEITRSRPHGHLAAGPGGAPGVEVGHAALVGRHHRGRGPGAGRGGHRRGLRRDGLAARPPGGDRGHPGPPAPGGGGEPGRDGLLRPDQRLDGRRALPAGGARLLPARQKGLPQIEYGLLTDPAGRPVAVRVFAGNTADPTAFSTIAEVVRNRFGLARLVLVGDRGMITSARIDALRELGGLGLSLIHI